MRKKIFSQLWIYFASIVFISILVTLLCFYLGMSRFMVGLSVVGILLWMIVILLTSGITIVSPNQAKVILFFGQYIGTIRESGMFMTVPLSQKINLSLKVRNFNSSVLKVNDFLL